MVGAVVIAGGTAVAVAATGGAGSAQGALLSGCLSSRTHLLDEVTLSPAQPLACRGKSTAVSWNQAGAPGAPAPTNPVVGEVVLPSGRALTISAFSGKVLQSPIGTSSGGAGAGKITFTPVDFTLSAGQGTPAFAIGATYASLHIFLYGPDGQRVVRWTLRLAAVSSVTTTADAASGGAQDAVELEVGAIEIQAAGPSATPTLVGPSVGPAPSGSLGVVQPSAVPSVLPSDWSRISNSPG